VPKKLDRFYFYSPEKSGPRIDASPTHPRTMSASMKQLIQSIIGRFGFRLIRLDDRVRPFFGLDSFFPLLKQFGFAPQHIIDVGANHGEWTRAAIRYFPDAQYTLVEPQDSLKVHISDLLDDGYKIRWLNVGAGDRRGDFLFSIFPDRDDCSSFALTKEEARGAGLRQITVEVRTLNDIASPTDMPRPEIVKIDAEGFDLRVLQGASDLFGKTDIFLVEACFCAPLENSVAAVVAFMANAGYHLIDITDLNRSPKRGVLWVSELAFLRNGSPLLEYVTSYE
jgi:FkbM family methyltransferase